MRVIVCGSRNWTGVYGEARIHTVLNIILALADVLGQLTIVHGDGPGADQVIDAWAVRREDDGVTVDRFPVKSAAWRQLHKGAGPIRTGPWSTRELTCVLGSCARPQLAPSAPCNWPARSGSPRTRCTGLRRFPEVGQP